MQAAQIYAQQFSSLQPNLWKWDLGYLTVWKPWQICSWISYSKYEYTIAEICAGHEIRTLLLIMMSRQDLMLSVKFHWKVNS